MFRKALLAVILTLPLMWASPAEADFIMFDPDGAGGVSPIAIDLLDPAPGNALTINGGATGVAEGGGVGADVQILFQANLFVADNSGTPGVDYANGQAGHYFTFVAGVPAEVTALDPTTGDIEFDITGGTPAAATATNFFYLYTTTNPAAIVAGGVPNNLSGVCFTCDFPILSGVFLDDAQFAASFSTDVNVEPPGPALDGFNTDNYPGVTTLSGTGGLIANIAIYTADPNFFPGLDQGALIKFFVDAASQNNLPFEAVDPSACFSLTGLVSCTYPGAGNANIGPINGEGVDIITETDASFGFQVEQNVIPEPATLTLLGFGLLGGLRARMKRGKK